MVWIDKILGLTIDLVSILFYNSEIKPHKQKLVRLGKPSSIERGDHLKWLIRKIGFHLPWTIAIKFTILLFLQSLFCFCERIVPKYSGNSMVPNKSVRFNIILFGQFSEKCSTYCSSASTMKTWGHEFSHHQDLQNKFLFHSNLWGLEIFYTFLMGDVIIEID